MENRKFAYLIFIRTTFYAQKDNLDVITHLNFVTTFFTSFLSNYPPGDAHFQARTLLITMIILLLLSPYSF